MTSVGKQQTTRNYSQNTGRVKLFRYQIHEERRNEREHDIDIGVSWQQAVHLHEENPYKDSDSSTTDTHPQETKGSFLPDELSCCNGNHCKAENNQ